MKSILINGVLASSVLKIELPESFPDIDGVLEDKYGVKLSEINIEDTFRASSSNTKWGEFR